MNVEIHGKSREAQRRLGFQVSVFGRRLFGFHFGGTTVDRQVVARGNSGSGEIVFSQNVSHPARPALPGHQLRSVIADITYRDQNSASRIEVAEGRQGGAPLQAVLHAEPFGPGTAAHVVVTGDTAQIKGIVADGAQLDIVKGTGTLIANIHVQ